MNDEFLFTGWIMEGWTSNLQHSYPSIRLSGKKDNWDINDYHDLFEKMLGLKLLYGSKMSVQYFISDVEMSYNEVLEEWLKKLYGYADIDFDYELYQSSVSSFDVSSTKFKIGGHNLYQELKSHVGKYLIFKVKIVNE